MEKDKQTNFGQIMIFAVILLALLFFLRIPFIASRLLPVIGIAAVASGIYLSIYYLRKKKLEKAYQRTEEGMAAARIQYCEEQIEKNEAELDEIRKNIEELQEQIDSPDISPRNETESKRLIKAFITESNLRKQKIEFFELCIGKLRRLVHNYKLTQDIARKREKLEKLKENHYDDLAALEELKTELEMSGVYLETIETLSLRMLESTDYDDAKKLQLELEEMTRDLDSL